MFERDAQRSKTLIIGDAMIDVYTKCRMERISPEAPVPILHFVEQFERLGGAANVAAGMAAMHLPCDLYALVGSDAQGDRLEDMLCDVGVGAFLHRVDGCPTIVKERILAMGQQICRVDREQRFSFQQSEALAQRVISSLDAYSIIVVSDYDKGASRSLRLIMDAASARNIPVLVDPKLADWSLYSGAFLIKPNWNEFREAAAHGKFFGTGESVDFRDRAAMTEIARRLMARYEIEHMVVTLGADGYLYFGPGNAFSAHPTRAREVFDLSGAGDTFLATLSAFFAEGAPLDVAIARGNEAAGIAVSRAGTCVIGRSDFESEREAKKTEHQILDQIHSLAQQGRKIVFTNGCFDLLHPGHLKVLREAKGWGDVLVVGVNSDASVARLKGPSRPIMLLDDRITMLAGLVPVDFVLPFEEDTPERLIRAVCPDVLVKGGDYSLGTVVGADFVIKRGGKVEIVSLVDGHSTTEMIRKASKPRTPAE